MSKQPTDLVVINSYENVIQAEMAKSFLQSRGIESYLKDEHIVAINWLYSNLVGGVKLCVQEKDEAQAKDLLQQADAQQLELVDEELPEQLEKPSILTGIISYKIILIILLILFLLGLMRFR